MDQTNSERSEEQQEKIAKFSGITGANLEEAAHLLEAMGWNLESAVNMYLEQGMGGPPPSTQDVPPVSNSMGGAMQQDIGGDDTNWEELQRIVDANEGPANVQSDDVRAADASFHDRLIGPNPRFPGRRLEIGENVMGNDLAIGINAILGAGLLPGMGPSPPIPGAPNLGPIMQPHAEPLDPRWLFPPPKDINHSGPFDQVRSIAKEQKKWLLVNIQDVNVFLSHQLNRDTWTNDTVRSMIDAGYIFWLRDNAHGHARQYIDRYHTNEELLPHIAIIDPRTAGKVEEYHGFIEPDNMATILMEFLETHSFESTRRANSRSPKIKSNKTLNNSEISSSNDNKESDYSVDNIQQNISEMKVNEDTNAPLNDDTQCKSVEEMQEVSEDKNASDSKEHEQFELGEEPTADAENVTTILIRMVDGKKAQRRFLLTDKVGVLFSWAKIEVPEACSKDFDIMNTFPSKSLKDDVDKSLNEAGLSNSTVRMRWC